MPSIVFDDWAGGLDLRRSVSMSAANVLFLLKNCYITTGKAIKKRPCIIIVTTLEAGTVGLKAAGGKLNTFYGEGAQIIHSNPLFRSNRVPNHITSEAPIKIHYAENFNGFLYVSAGYASAVQPASHHYLDDATDAWEPSTAYAFGVFVRPRVPNGFRYQVNGLSGTGTSGASDPAWGLIVGDNTIDNPGANQISWRCQTYVANNGNCPHSKQVKKIGQKIYAASGSDVRFCATAAPKDWETADDAGFIPSGINAAGSDTVTALGDYRGKLGIFYADSTQLWKVDPDPALNELVSNAENIGTLHYDTPRAFANDLVFLSKMGFRSVTLSVLSDDIQENDIGSPIDKLRSEIADGDEPHSIYFPRLGQLWIVNGSRVYVITYSKSNKITAWSVYDFPVEFSDVTVLDNEVYGRSGNDVYRFDQTIFNDDGEIPLCEVEMFFQDGKLPGHLKMFIGLDTAVIGTSSIAFRYDPRNTNLMTAFVPLSSDTRPDALAPMEISAVAIAPVVRHQLDEDFQLDLLQCYFEKLGPI